ncbi:hypothetical protein CACET_c27200 [Clostridium aceticum]|uniref:Uncharacterized protein n=1 Tax=Clostridium aceticum TaxID=84022 RepID=A0A0D8IBI6_9CLOT|nr:hypothetical protein [Clostridium aceticum]AKL96165.1 hypothetical protein CACET_c27200 [Clostridium aceticum]KJF26586.1 hypothetical protein TZ02_11970 [Clostridium aceticum]
MAVKHLKDIIKPKAGYKENVKAIIEGFKSTIRRDIPRRQEENLKKLASLFLNPVKVEEPIVVNLDIGQGKSTLLIEFVKYMYTVNKEFSSVIVKRTLNEGREFCMDVGVKFEPLKQQLKLWCDETTYKQSIEELYYGDLEDYKEYGYLRGQEKPHEDYFIARLIRGFNYKDCLVWKDPKKIKNYFGSLPSEYVEYSPILCKDCQRNCGVKLSRWSIEKHPSLVITHQRLFLSNDLEEVMEKISGREVLIIDEKLETKDIDNILLEEWEAILTKMKGVNLAEEIKAEIDSVEKYIGSLEYPNTSGSGIKRVNQVYNSKFRFNHAIYGVLSEKYEDVVTLNKVEKFLNYGGSTSRSWHKNDKKQFSYIRYIDLKNYSKYFNKTIILDATSRIDNDYKKSNVIFLDELHETPKGKLNLFYSPQKTAKSSLIYSNNSKNNHNKGYRNFKGNKEFYLTNINLLAQEVEEIIKSTAKDTLVICYKEIVDKLGNVFSFEEDIKNAIQSLDIKDIKCTIRHFGAATTGVNDFKDYGNIVFLGMLNKGELYYTNKTISIGNEEGYTETRLNEYVIDCIQQIGRISVRQGLEGNVYMLFYDDLSLIDKLKKHFTIKNVEWHPKYFNGINNATDFKKTTCWYAIVEELKNLKEEKLSLKDLQSKLPQFKPDTVYRSVNNPYVGEYMKLNDIHYNKKEKLFIKKFTKNDK